MFENEQKSSDASEICRMVEERRRLLKENTRAVQCVDENMVRLKGEGCWVKYE